MEAYKVNPKIKKILVDYQNEMPKLKADAILASGAISIGYITDTILVIIAGVSLVPISTAAISTLAGAIVSF